MLPCVRTPIATRTWDGSSVAAVHEEPLLTANPSWSSARSRASPSTYRQENVTRWGSRSTGSPTTCTSVIVAATRSLIRSTRARSRASSAALSRRTASRAAAAAMIPGRSRHHSRSSCGQGERQRTPVRTASTPTPAGPPHSEASAVSSDHPDASDARPTTWEASTSSGTPTAAQACATPATGWVVPTSWLAAIRQASAVSGRSATAYAPTSTRPTRLTGMTVRSPSCASSAASTAECSMELCTTCEPVRRRPARAPSTPRWAAAAPPGVKRTSSGRAPSAAATLKRALSSSSRARRPAL